MTREEVAAFLDAEFPQIRRRFALDAVTDEGVRMSLVAGDAQLRPGGTVSGPTLFALADAAFYAATLSRVGPEALAVTTHASIDFMRRPAPGTITAEARILKLGRTLCVGDVLLFAEGSDGPVAHATMTYALPPRR